MLVTINKCFIHFQISVQAPKIKYFGVSCTMCIVGWTSLHVSCTAHVSHTACVGHAACVGRPARFGRTVCYGHTVHVGHIILVGCTACVSLTMSVCRTVCVGCNLCCVDCTFKNYISCTLCHAMTLDFHR